MTDKRNNIDRLFATARTEPPVVSFDETRAAVEGHQPSGSYRTHETHTTTSTIMITSGLAILAAATIGFLAWNSGDVDGRIERGGTNTTGEEAVRRIDATNGRTGDHSAPTEAVDGHDPVRTAGTTPADGKEARESPYDDSPNEEKDSNGLFVEPAPFIAGLRTIELSRGELGRLGIQPDTAGVWSFYRNGKETHGLQCSMYGTAYDPDMWKIKASSTTIPDFHPVVITDDFGNRRIEYFDDSNAKSPDDALSSTTILLERWQVLERDLKTKLVLYFRSQDRMATMNDSMVITAFTDPRTSRRRLVRIEIASMQEQDLLKTSDKIHAELGTELYQEIMRKDYEHLELEPERVDGSARLAAGNLIPVLVRTGREYTDADRDGNRWRPDCIFWYEPTPEFLAALPERIRERVMRELKFAALIERKPSHESISSFIGRQSADIRQAFDSMRAGADESSTAAVAGEGLTGALDATSGTITFSSVTPNPARDFMLVRYTLGAPRTVLLALYDVNGALIRPLDRLSVANAGEHLHSIDLKGLPPGMYLLVISTEKERAIQRVIVE